MPPENSATTFASRQRFTLGAELAAPLLGIALVFGVLADSLLRVTPWGLNVLLVVLLGLAGATALARLGHVQLTGEGRWLAPAILFFAVALVWRDSPTLTFANSAALLVATTLAALTAKVGQVRKVGLTQYVLGVVYMAGYALVGLFPVLAWDIAWRRIGRRWWAGPAVAAGRGVLLAVPPLVVFGSLFAAADAQFERFIDDLFELDGNHLILRVTLIGVYAWLLGGMLREMLLAPERPRDWQQPPSRLRLGTVELTVVLGLLDALFATFVVFQLPYLFGGHAQIETLGYSTYARRGFFELVWVSGLSLGLLLFVHWLIRKQSPLAERIYRLLAGALIVLLCVVMASAVQRMQLYVVEYGLTELRVQASAFMAWLALVLAWFAVTVLRGQRQRFAFGALVSAFVVIASLNMLNPDALIVRTNAAHGTLIANGPFDQRGLASFSADAVPAIVEALPSLSAADRATVEGRLRARWPRTDAQPDWRAFNWSRTQARAAVASLE